MVAATYNMTIEQGATYRLVMVYGRKSGTQDAQGNEIVDPYDITGCAARMQVRQRRDSEVLISATTLNGGILIPTGTDGKLIITISDEATDSLSVKKALYDLELSYPSGDVVRVMQGKVTISTNITRGADQTNISTGLGDEFEVDEQDVDVDTDVAEQPSTAF